MVRTSEVGSQTIVSFQTKYPTFTPADFDKTMMELGFQRNTTQNKAGQVQQYVYTKEHMIVDHNALDNILNFRLFNTVNVSKVYDDIKNSLLKLKIDPSTMNIMGLDCRTMAHEVGNPEDNLTSLFSTDAKKRIATLTEFEPAVYSVVLVNKDPKDEDLQIRVEPLASNPKESFFIHINYKTSVHEKFNSFIGKFGEETISNIAKGLCEKNAKID